MTNQPNRRWWQFRISTVLLLMVIVAIGVGRSLDSRQKSEQLSMQRRQLETQAKKLRALSDYAKDLREKLRQVRFDP